MLEFGNREFRNLQEQVGKNKEDIATLKSGIKISYTVMDLTELNPLITEENVGKYVYLKTPKLLYLITRRANEGLIATNLGEYPAVAKGEKGDDGENGEQGERGTGIYGVGTSLPSADAYKEGDFYLLANGNIYKKIIDKWIHQCSIQGPQGIQGPEGTDVVANPAQEPTDFLSNIKIDGISYHVLAPDKRVLLGKMMYSSTYGVMTTAGTNFTVSGDTRIMGQLDVDNRLTASEVDVSSPEDITFSVDDTTLADKLQDVAITTDKLESVLEGSESVVIDLNQEGDKLQARLDNDVTNAINRSLKTPLVTPTEKMLVGVDTSNSQAMFKIGAGLEATGFTSPFTLQTKQESYELISNETLTEDVNTYIKNFTNRCKKIRIIVELPNTYTSVGNLLIIPNRSGPYVASNININQINVFYADLSVEYGLLEGFMSGGSSYNSSLEIRGVNPIGTNRNFSYIDSVEIDCSGGQALKANTKITIYGVRK